MNISSTAFTEGGMVPQKYTCDGTDISPPLKWDAVPAGTKSIAIISDDPDAPVGTWVHWVLYDIPADTRQLPEDLPTESNVLGTASQGQNDFRKLGYGGPAPPPGKAHRYFFKLYAVDAKTGLSASSTKEEVLDAIEGHVLAKTQLMGTYER